MRVCVRVVTAFALACGSGCSSTADAPASALPPAFTEEAMRAASTLFDTKVCAAIATCDPIRLERDYGGMEACIGRDRPRDELAARFGYGSVLTPDALAACADALDLSTCEAFVHFQHERIVPAACRPLHYGSLLDGSACKSANQCASGRCFVAPSESCGRCAPQLPSGAPCAGEAACEPGSTCGGAGPEARCAKLGAFGEPCHPLKRPCHAYLVCSEICLRPILDNRCEVSAGCAAQPGLRYCNPETRACERVVFADIGQPCGPKAAPPYFVYCARGSACTRIASGTASLTQFACLPLIDDGGACVQVGYDSPCRNRTSVCARNICRASGPAQCSAPPVLP